MKDSELCPPWKKDCQGLVKQTDIHKDSHQKILRDSKQILPQLS